jgi:hypothetical protein
MSGKTQAVCASLFIPNATIALVLILAAFDQGYSQLSPTPPRISALKTASHFKTSDIIAGGALIISLVSLAISIKTSSFNTKVKGLELRALLLSTLNNALIKAENLLTDYEQCRDAALKGKAIDILDHLYQRKFDDKIAQLVTALKNDIDTVEGATGKAAIKLYETMNARTISGALRVDEVASEMASLKTNMITKLATEYSDAEAKSPLDNSPPHE